MNFKPKKFLSLLTASLLAAGGLVGVVAAPAQAVDAPAPALLVDYENATLVQSPWPSLTDLNFSEGGNGWTNYVAAGDQPGASAGSTKMLKGKMGSGAYSGTFLVKTTTNSLLSAAKPVVSMKFYAPEAGKIVRMTIESGDYPNVVGSKSVDATAVTVVGWQILRFDFSAQNPDYTLVLNRAFIDYDPASTAVSSDFFVDDISFNGAATPDLTGQAPSPALLVDYENATLVQSPWPSLTDLNFSEGNNGWTNYVADADMPGGVSGSTKMLKAKMGSGAYSGTFVIKTTTNSLLSASQPVVSMRFNSPEAGKIVRMTVESGDYPNVVGSKAVNATALTVLGWQTLYFDFSGQNPNYSLVLNRAFIDYDPASTGVSLDFFVDNISFNELGISSGAVQQQAPAQTVNYDVRLTSALKNTATDAYQWADCGGQSWCVNNNYFMKMIAAGSSTTLTYVVTTHGTTTPVANASVNLRINTAYSGSNATWSSNGTSFGTVSSGSGSDAGTISGTTNSSGEVSFTFANTNTTGEAARTLNNANPYPSGCASPAGQTKGAIEPTVTAVSGATIGTQYVDVLWPHISSSTIESSIAAGSDGQNCAPTITPRPGTKVWSPYFDQDKKGFYPHVRLEKSFLNEKLDGTWWDGVWQNRDADSRAYLKYLPVGSTFALTYHVTDEYGAPYVGAKVSLIVNANYSCAKTFFSYEGSLIGPDDCAGGGETELPAKTVGADGRVTFVLTNTNTTGEAMPVDLNGAPNPATKEVGTNIKPNVVGAKQQGIDMLFAHFVEPSGLSKATGPAAKTATIGAGEVSEFTLTDDAGKPLSNTDVKYFVNGFDSKAGFARTDAAGKVRIHSTNSVGLEGVQTVGVSLVRDGKLPLAATATINWMAPELSIAAAGAANSVVVKVAGAAGKTVKITIAGKVYTRVAKSANASFTIATGAGKKAVKVSVPGKTLSKSVTVTRK
jgi:predicted nucleic acid-binding Zn finger protein